MIPSIRFVRLPSRRRLAMLSLVCALLLLPAVAVFLFAPSVPERLTLARTDLRLAAWLSVSWSMEAHDASQVEGLAGELKALGVDDVYVFISYLKADGSFNRTYDFASEFAAALKRYAPELRALAWIGVPVSLPGAMPASRLRSAEIRRTIADFARFAATDLGFDGLHINAELIADGDSAFLELLATIREALPAGAFFSATAHPLRLDEMVTVMPYPAVAHHWSTAYFRRVAQHVDQTVLMAYDSGLVFPRDYLHWTRHQASRSQEALGDISAELIIGASVSEEWTISHQTQAESLSLFLAGLKAGLSGRLDGIALYPYWELDRSEMQLIARALNRRGGSLISNPQN